MADYIISTHGKPRYGAKTIVPGGVSVRFYQPFGAPMENDVGFLLQSALRRPLLESSMRVLKDYPQVALWTGPTEKEPEINLTGDNHDFYTGVVHAETGKVIEAIGVNKLVTLTGALRLVREDATKRNEAGATVHCLFCL